MGGGASRSAKSTPLLEAAAALSAKLEARPLAIDAQPGAAPGLGVYWSPTSSRTEQEVRMDSAFKLGLHEPRALELDDCALMELDELVRELRQRGASVHTQDVLDPRPELQRRLETLVTRQNAKDEALLSAVAAQSLLCVGGAASVPFHVATFGASAACLTEAGATLAQPLSTHPNVQNADALHGRVAIAQRGECTFVEKARRVQQAGALALVVVNNVDEELMPGDSVRAGFDIHIPVAMVALGDGRGLLGLPAQPDPNATVSLVFKADRRKRKGRHRAAPTGAAAMSAIGAETEWKGAARRQRIAVEMDAISSTYLRDDKRVVAAERDAQAVREAQARRCPPEAAHLLIKAVAHWRACRYQEACASLVSCIEAGHTRPALCHAHRGSCMLQLQCVPEALECFDEAIAVNPDELLAWKGRCAALSLLHRLEEAHEARTRATQVRSALDEARVREARTRLDYVAPRDEESELGLVPWEGEEELLFFAPGRLESAEQAEQQQVAVQAAADVAQRAVEKANEEQYLLEPDDEPEPEPQPEREPGQLLLGDLVVLSTSGARRLQGAAGKRGVLAIADTGRVVTVRDPDKAYDKATQHITSWTAYERAAAPDTAQYRVVPLEGLQRSYWYNASDLQLTTLAPVADASSLPSSLDPHYLAQMKQRYPEEAAYFERLGSGTSAHVTIVREKRNHDENNDRDGTIKYLSPAAPGVSDKSTSDVPEIVSGENHGVSDEQVESSAKVTDEQAHQQSHTCPQETIGRDEKITTTTPAPKRGTVFVFDPLNTVQKSAAKSIRDSLEADVAAIEYTWELSSAFANREKKKWQERSSKAIEIHQATYMNLDRSAPSAGSMLRDSRRKLESAGAAQRRNERLLLHEQQKKAAMDMVTAVQANSLVEGHSEVHTAVVKADLDALHRMQPLEVNVKLRFGISLCMLAATQISSKVLSFLIDRGGDIDAQDDEGQSSLQYAVAAQSVSCVKLLIAHGALLTIKDNNGTSALDSARQVAIDRRSKLDENIDKGSASNGSGSNSSAQSISTCDEIVGLLESASGVVAASKINEGMSAHKREQWAKWGLRKTSTSSGGTGVKTASGERHDRIFLVNTAAEKALFDIVMERANKKLPMNESSLCALSESQVVELLGLPPGAVRAAKNKRELARWLLPRASAQWEEVCDALAVRPGKRSSAKLQVAGAVNAATSKSSWSLARSTMATSLIAKRTTKERESALRGAAARGETATVLTLLSQGVNTHATSELGWSAYNFAMANGHKACAKALMDAGCSTAQAPEMSKIMSSSAKVYEVLVRSVIREGFEVSSAEVGLLLPGAQVKLYERRVNTTGAVRVRVHLGWTTFSGKSADARTTGFQRFKAIVAGSTSKRLSFF